MPPAVVMLPSTKFGEASLRVKVSTAVWPIFKVVLLEAMVMAGVVVSTVMESCVAAVLLLPAPSVKVLAATLMLAGVVLLLVGVKVAV